MKHLITYGTHLPLLTRALLEQSGLVVEMGGGLSSTPLLNQFARTGRKVITFESNPEFYNTIKELECQNHRIELVNDWKDVPAIAASIVFIDHAPAERRIVDIAKFKHALILVVHDFEKKAYYGYNKILPLFKYVKEYTYYPKTTAVLSNFVDVTGWEM